MPITGITQPDLIPIEEDLRLRKFDNSFAFALEWYLDPETVMLVDGVNEPYDMDKLTRMYTYLDAHGELYWIEVRRAGRFTPVGDVTFSRDDLPIVIGERSLRGQGIGRKVVAALICRGRALGYPTLRVNEIYHNNIGSRRLFEGLGFRSFENTEKGQRYRLNLKEV